MNTRNRTGIALLVLALNIPLWTGCGTMTTDLSTTKHAPGIAAGTGAFGAAVFDRERDIDGNAFTSNRVECSLYREDGGSVLVKQTTEPSFEVPDLPPGKYRLHVAGWRNGNSSNNPSATREKKFSVASGTRVQANVVLNDYGPAISGGSAVLIAIGIGLVIALLSSFSSGGSSTSGIRLGTSLNHATPAVAPDPCAAQNVAGCRTPR